MKFRLAGLALLLSACVSSQAAGPDTRAGKQIRQDTGIVARRETDTTHRPNPAPTQRAISRNPEAETRFFFSGNGRLRLAHGHFNTTLDIRYRHADGSYDEAALKKIDEFFRSRGDGRHRPMSLRLIELLSFVQERFRPGSMTLLSGYRSPEFNAELGAAGAAVAMASLHTQGLAADIHLGGIDQRKLWQRLRELKTGGVGFYKSQKFLHIDVGPPRFWEETTSRVSENLSAGNARMFVRTDFDRYGSLIGAALTLHSVTTLPLYVAADARVVNRRGSQPIRLAGTGAIRKHGTCWEVSTPEETYGLTIESVGAETVEGGDPEAEHFYLLLHTCEPRIEKTPLEVRSNPIELE